MATFPYAAIKECKNCWEANSDIRSGDKSITKHLQSPWILLSNQLAALYHAKMSLAQREERRDACRRQAVAYLERYLASPSQGAWETATRARVSGLLKQCSTCDYSAPFIAEGLAELIETDVPL